MAHVGRGVFWKKTQTEACLRLDMSRLAKKIDFTLAQTGYSTWTSGLGKESMIAWKVIPETSLLLTYTLTPRSGEPENLSYYVCLETTPCFFGNSRWWFNCPSCYRRCRLLYLPPGQKYFACRVCYKLTYQSQQEGKTKWSSFFAYLDVMPLLEERFQRTRSRRKQTQIANKMLRMSYEIAKLHSEVIGKRKKRR